MDLNRATLIGRLTHEPELRTIPSGQSVTTFSIATNYTWTDSSGVRQEKPEYHNIVAWGKLAEICAQYLGKGRRVYIEGRLQTREWDGKDGVKRRTTEIVADNMIMLDPPRGAVAERPARPSFPPPAPSVVVAPSAPGEDEVRVEDIPF